MRWFKKLEETLLCLCLVMMAILTFIQTIGRFFGVGIDWADPFTLILNSWLVFVGGAYCIREKAHIGIEILTDRLVGKVAKLIAMIAIAGCLAYAFLYLYGAVSYFIEDYLIDIDMEDLPFPTWYGSIVLVVGFTLIAIRFVVVCYHIVINNNVHALRHESEVKDSMELAKSIKVNN